jgi:hypothetical protein
MRPRKAWERKLSDYRKLAGARLPGRSEVLIFERVDPQQLLDPVNPGFKKANPKT